MSDAQTIPKIFYNSTKDKANFTRRWWTKDKDQAHLDLISTVKNIEDNQRYRSVQNLKHARLYSNMELRGLSAFNYGKVINNLPNNRATLNVIMACIDTATARIAKSRPRPLILTEKGNASLQRRAKNLTQYCDGMFDAARVYEQSQMCFTEAAVFGTGAFKVIKGESGIETERVPIDEVIVEDADGLYGKPRCIYHRQWLAREVLMEQYKKDPSTTEAIERATHSIRDEGTVASGGEDRVYVIEAWHLPSGPKATDGRHIIAIDDQTLFDEEWKHPFFPILFFPYRKRLQGFYGSGIAENLVGIQIEINKILRDISQSLNLFAVPRIYRRVGTKVTKVITNTIGEIIEFDGPEPPQPVTPSAAAPDVHTHLWQLYQRSFEMEGLSQLSATSQKPAGLDSGEAIRTFNDIETGRFEIVGQRWEDFHVDIADVAITFTKEMESLPAMRAKGSKFIRSIDWKDVDMERDKFEMRVFPTNLLPQTPEGRLARVQDLINDGLIPKEDGMALLDFPDVEDFISLQTAGLEDVKWILEEMLDHGKPQQPEPFMNLQLALRMSQSAYLRAKANNEEEGRLQLVRDFMSACVDLINVTAQPAPGTASATNPAPALPAPQNQSAPAPPIAA